LGIRLSTLSSPIFPAACYLEILPIDPVINPSSLVIDNFASLIQVIWLFITPLIVVLKLRLHATSQQEKLMTNASKQERLRSCMIGLTPVVSLLLGALPLSRCCPPFPSRTWRYRRYVAQPCASAIPATAIFFWRWDHQLSTPINWGYRIPSDAYWRAVGCGRLLQPLPVEMKHRNSPTEPSFWLLW